MNHKKGLTLVEVLVVVTILSVLALSVYTVFKSGLDVWSRSEARLDIYQNGRVALDQISRELVGAFSVTGASVFQGTDGSGTSSDVLIFLTNFGDSIYRVKYELDAGSNILRRYYIDYAVTFGASYTDDPETSGTPIDFVSPTKNAMVSNIQFQYLPAMPLPTGMNDWIGFSMDSWPGGEPADSLPKTVKIILTLKDANDKDYVFETIVYLPNSETE